ALPLSAHGGAGRHPADGPLRRHLRRPMAVTHAALLERPVRRLPGVLRLGRPVAARRPPARAHSFPALVSSPPIAPNRAPSGDPRGRAFALGTPIDLEKAPTDTRK